MEIIKYCWYKGRLLLYVLIACLLSYLICFLADTAYDFKLAFMIFLQIFLLRLFDDYYDYQKDSLAGKLQLNKALLKRLLVVVSMLYLAINIYSYGLYGMFSLLIVGLINMEQKYAIIQNFLALISALYYISQIHAISTFKLAEMLFLLMILIVSVLFVMFKRKK